MRVREHVDFIAADGTVYPLHVPSRVGKWVMSHDGLGMPPIEYITERGPFQHGETVKDFFLRPRIVQLLIRQQFCSREEYWTGRAALINAIRPNRQLTVGAVSSGTLRLTLPNGVLRSLDCYIESGPRFEPRRSSSWDEWAFQEVLRFIAYNPVLYDPADHFVTFSEGSVAFFPASFPIPMDTPPELVFPIEFPITFFKIDRDANVVYTGTWIEYPVITLTGPLLNPIITNETTGEVLELSYEVPAGVVVTIDLAPGRKTVIDSTGANLVGVMTPESDLGTWHMEPAPVAPGGINTVHAEASAIDLLSSIDIRWKARYIGI